MLNNATIVDYGLKLVDACINTYQSDMYVCYSNRNYYYGLADDRDRKCSTGIGPEVFAYTGSDGGNYTGGPGPSASDQAFYNQHGFYVYDGYAYLIISIFVYEYHTHLVNP